MLWGLEGAEPETVDTRPGARAIRETNGPGRSASGQHEIAFDPESDLVLHRRGRSLPFHPNGMTFTAYADDAVVDERTYYSIGGGFVVDEGDGVGRAHAIAPDPTPCPTRSGLAAPSCSRCATRPAVDQRRDARQRVRPEPGGRGPRRAAADLGA